MFTYLCHLEIVFWCTSYLPSLTAPPAGVCGDTPGLASGFLGQEGKFTHGTADESIQVDWWRLNGFRTAGRDQERQRAQNYVSEFHAVREAEMIGGHVKEARAELFIKTAFRGHHRGMHWFPNEWEF